MLVANQPGELKAVGTRHHQVDDCKVERAGGESRKRTVRIRNGLDFEAFAAQTLRGGARLARLVVDYQDTGLHFIFSRFFGSRAGIRGYPLSD